MELKLKRRDDAEVAAAAAQRPEQILMLLRACPDEFAVSRDHVGG
jgi:hypothetical protein